MELFHLSPPFCLGFLGTNPLAISHVLGFLGTKTLAVPSYHPNSQEAKNLFKAAFCSFFFALLNGNIIN